MSLRRLGNAIIETENLLCIQPAADGVSILLTYDIGKIFGRTKEILIEANGSPITAIMDFENEGKGIDP